jgi:glycosyltransferase involved in cell wall biosynthesis
LREIDPDVMHSHSSKAGILARRAAAGVGGMQVVHTIHGLPFHPYETYWRNALYVALERRAARWSDAIVCVADAMSRQALAAGVGRPEQYRTVYSGMDVGRFLERPPSADAFRASLNLPAGALLVTQVSRLAELKGHEYIIEAARRIDEPRVIFCLVGDGHLRQQIEDEIARAGLGERFRLTGLLAPRQIPAVMHATDILVHCSLREGLARTLPQAMLAGVPVISWDVDGAGEVLSDRTGLLLDRGDVAGLTAGIEALAADPARRDALGQAGRELCCQRFDYREMVRQLDELYRRL